MRSVLEARFAQTELLLAAERAKADAQWRKEIEAGMVLAAVVGLIILSYNYPEQTRAVVSWIERIFGATPAAGTAAPAREASETTSAAASPEAPPRRTRRPKDPVTPPGPESSWVPSSVEPAQGHA